MTKAKTAATDAKDASQPTEELDARVTELSGLRDTMFKGETFAAAALTPQEPQQPDLVGV